MNCCEDNNCFEQEHICVSETNLPRVVVVGGGFAGLNLIKRLKDLSVQVVLIDKNNFHQFLPLLYQVASGRIQPDNVVFPFRQHFKNYMNLAFRMAEAVHIETRSNTLQTTKATGLLSASIIRN